MRLLSIETSCDETAVSLVDATGVFPDATYTILGNALHSQIAIHQEYGGVYPALAKREHALALVPMLQTALHEAELLEAPTLLDEKVITDIRKILEREPGLADALIEFLETHGLPEIDMIAVTSGPGLEPALWMGINFARALSVVTRATVVPVNHMEGHVLASIYNVERPDQLSSIAFPALALLVSGGHTELVHLPTWGRYEKIGQTRDDAAGEAFDKVARLMSIPYPGGPEISRLAATARTANLPPFGPTLPRPMINSGDFDFSFSGLKTAVRVAIGKRTLSESEKAALARDFEDAVVETLVAKSLKAALQYTARTFIVGGGVAANTRLKAVLTETFLRELPETEVYFPARALTTDNSIMIALAGHANLETARTAGAIHFIRAEGNRSL